MKTKDNYVENIKILVIIGVKSLNGQKTIRSDIL